MILLHSLRRYWRRAGDDKLPFVGKPDLPHVGTASDTARVRAARSSRMSSVPAVGQWNTSDPKLPPKRALLGKPRLPNLHSTGVRNVQRRVRALLQRLLQDR